MMENVSNSPSDYGLCKERTPCNSVPFRDCRFALSCPTRPVGTP